MPLKRLFLCLSLFLFCTTTIKAQGIVPTTDFNNYFVSFQDGFFRPIEIQPIVNYKAGDEMVAYIDTRGNLKIYDGKQRIDVTTLNVDYQVSDHLMAYRIANGLRMWDVANLPSLRILDASLSSEIALLFLKIPATKPSMYTGIKKLRV